MIYLIFNEGYAATEGPSLTRADLCAEAIRLGRLVVELLDEPEALGLLALMLLHEARRAARVDAAGDLVLLEDQDRSLWDRGADRRGAGPDRAGAGPRDASGPTSCRRPSRRFTPRRRAPAKPTGPRSSRSTTCSSASTPRRWWP